MDFLEQLGRRLSDAGQGVAQQTKNLTELTRLSGTISEKGKQLCKAYAEIGQSYYERHRLDPNGEERPLMESVSQLLSEIAQCREEIKQIKGVTKCQSCGADIPLRAAFCNSCGARVSPQTDDGQAPPPKTGICPNCRAAVPEGNQFCNHCGARLES